MMQRGLIGVLALSFALGCSGVAVDATELHGTESEELSVGSAALALTQAQRPHAERERGRRQRGSFYTGKYDDLFRDLGYTKAEVRAKIDAAFAQLFHGDPESESVYFEVGSNEHGPLAQIRD